MSLVVAIFLITVIASLAAFAVTVGTATHESENLQLLADRARAAASAGAEWAAYRAMNGGNCANLTTFNLTQAALRGFRVTVSCARLGSGARPVYDIDSFAQLGVFGAVNYTSRHVTKRVW
jgi:hypothetical protein